MIAHGADIALTCYNIGNSHLIYTQPGSPPARKYGVCAIVMPALEAQLTVNRQEARGRPLPTQREGQPFSTCAPAFSES